MNIVCVGDCGVDRYVPSGDDLVGGITANVARNLRSELPPDFLVQIISCVGDDQFAGRVISELSNANIDCHFEQLPGTTSVQEIRIGEDGEKQFTNYDEGVLRDFEFSDKQRAIIESSDVLIAPVYRQIRGLFDRLMAIETRGLVCVDFADFLAHPDFALVEQYNNNVDIAFFGLSVDEIDIIKFIADLARESKTIFVVTLAENGSRVFDGLSEYHHPAHLGGRVVDTTGAGDAYAAGFIAARLREADINEAMCNGAQLARRAIGDVGAFHA